jgi:hypothetical protein
MNEINRRYFDGLLADRKLSLRGLAREMDMSHSQLSLALSGQRKFQTDELVKISDIFAEPITRVMENAGVRAGSGRRVSVIGAVRGDGTVELYGKDIIERVTVPEELPDSVVAVQYRTAGSPIEWLDGAVSFFREPYDVDPAAIGRLAFCKIKDGPAVITGVRRGYKENTFNLYGNYNAESVVLEMARPLLITRY